MLCACFPAHLGPRVITHSDVPRRIPAGESNYTQKELDGACVVPCALLVGGHPSLCVARLLHVLPSGIVSRITQRGQYAML
jgi:hypothetical protein